MHVSKRVPAIENIAVSRRRTIAKKIKVRRATSDYSSVSFEPWPFRREKSTMVVPRTDRMLEIGASATLACEVMYRSREDLIEMHNKVERHFVDAMASDDQTAERLKELAAVLEAASLRVLMSGAAANARRASKPTALRAISRPRP